MTTQKIYAAIDDLGRIIATNDEPFTIQPHEQLIAYIPERSYPTQETPGAFGYVSRLLHLGEKEQAVIFGKKSADAEPLYKDYGHFDAWKMVLEELRDAPKPAYKHGLTGIEETRRQLQHLIALAQDGEQMRAFAAEANK